MQRNLSHCLRVAVGWVTQGGILCATGPEAGLGPTSASSLDAVWSLIAELYDRPLEAPLEAPAAAEVAAPAARRRRRQEVVVVVSLPSLPLLDLDFCSYSILTLGVQGEEQHPH